MSCPVIHTKKPAGEGCPVSPASSANAFQQAASSSSVSPAINPANAMPTTPNQTPAAGQRMRLPTGRVESTIPNGACAEAASRAR